MSWCIHDAIELERRGVPTVTLVARPFAGIARYQTEAVGLPGIRVVALPYPVGGIPPEIARGYATEAIDDVLAGLIGKGS